MTAPAPAADVPAAMSFTARAGRRADAAAIAAIYNQGIDDRVATFETEHRDADAIGTWFDAGHPLVVVEDAGGDIVSYAAAFPYRARPCYDGVREFSVYVRRDARGTGCGRAALAGLIEAARVNGAWKLLSRIFPENTASLALCHSLGFREVGTYTRHGKLDGRWRDTVIVEILIDEEGEPRG
ncbi:arsinothricin resistance N-acetyltransferase ArsN1 family A [Stappia sp.]|uniref:arsinothricin resistance N-acetyltransferase ArsN1 family A n=1 Tax=Stappia sp. TaxID=1870903 RepID=UPI003D0EBBBF